MKIFSLKFVNRTIKVLLLFLFGLNLAACFYMPILAVFVTTNIVGATLATVGISIAIYSIFKSLLQVPLAKMLDRRAGEEDDFWVIFTGSVLAIVYSFGYLLIRHVWELYFLEMLCGVADACMMAAYYAIFSHHIDKDSEGFEWSLFSTGISISTALGGLIGGFVALHFGFNALFIAAGVLNISGTFLLIGLYPSIKIMRKAHTYKKISHKS